jgi:hypothetical protein
MTRVRANSGNYTSLSVVANDTMLKMLKAASIRSQVKRMNTYTGLNLNAARTPLINDVGIASDDWINSWVAGDFSEATGATGDASAKYLDTGTTQLALYNLDSTNHSVSYGVYCRTASDLNQITMGVYNNTNYDYLYVSNGSGHSFFSMTDNAQQIDVADSAGSGFYLGVRTSSSNGKLYKNGVQIGTSGSMGSQGQIAYKVYVHAVNNIDSTTPVAPTSKTLAGYQLGINFDSTQQAALYAAWQRVQTILGRQV